MNQTSIPTACTNTRHLKVFHLLIFELALVILTGNAAAPLHDYPVKPVPFTAVHLNDAFWTPRIETNRLVSIPFAFEQCEKSGRMDNFDRARHCEARNSPTKKRRRIHST